MKNLDRRGFLGALLGAALAGKLIDHRRPAVDTGSRAAPVSNLTCHMRTGGVVCFYPASIRYMDGI